MAEICLGIRISPFRPLETGSGGRLKVGCVGGFGVNKSDREAGLRYVRNWKLATRIPTKILTKVITTFTRLSLGREFPRHRHAAICSHFYAGCRRGGGAGPAENRFRYRCVLSYSSKRTYTDSRPPLHILRQHDPASKWQRGYEKPSACDGSLMTDHILAPSVGERGEGPPPVCGEAASSRVKQTINLPSTPQNYVVGQAVYWTASSGDTLRQRFVTRNAARNVKQWWTKLGLSPSPAMVSCYR